MPSPSPERRLAAVMFTDIVGYTALMQENEAKALAQRQVHRQVFEAQHEQHHGQILQYFGDGTLSIFQSGVEAVACAIAIQRAFLGDADIPLRIGIHMGDLVYDGTDIYGDGVNVAARIESMGVAGSVLLSGKLNDELHNHQQISTQSLGFFQLKNIRQPMEIFAVSNAGLVLPQRHELRGKQAVPKHSVAVLPFINRSSNEEMEYLSDGMTEEIINALSSIQSLKVTSRTSSFFYKNKRLALPQIGQELKVAYILEGSIRVASDQMRVSATLVDVQEDVPLWSQNFDRALDDIFAVQDEMSLLIAERLREHIGHFDIADQLVTPPPVSVDHYRDYLKSRYHILKMSEAEIEIGMGILQEIIAQEPDFPLAQLGMHLAYTLLGTLGMRPAVEAFAAGQPYLEKAIELDDQLPEIQLHLAYHSFLQDWDLPQTYQHLQNAFEIRPTVEYYQSMCSVLVADGKFSAAHHYIEQALQIDPFSNINHHLKGFVYYVQEQYEQAIPCFRKSLEIKSGALVSLPELGQSLLLLGRHQEAHDFFAQLDLPKDDLLKIGGLCMVESVTNPSQAAEGIQQLQQAMNSSQADRAINLLLIIYALRGEHDRALELLAEAIKMRLPMIVYTQSDPTLKPLRQHPQFQELTKQIFGHSPVPELPKRKYKKSLLDAEALDQYKEQLTQLMETEQPYLAPDLSLRDLATRLHLPANYLSQLLNEGFDQNFSEYVNTYRLAAFQEKVVDPDLQHLTILGLAYESGFNSKTVFNTFFKKVMGQTPAAYRKAMLKT